MPPERPQMLTASADAKALKFHSLTSSRLLFALRMRAGAVNPGVYPINLRSLRVGLSDVTSWGGVGPLIAAMLLLSGCVTTGGPASMMRD